MNSEGIVAKVLPAFATLGGDPDATVRFSSIQAFGTVAIANLEDQVVSFSTSSKQLLLFSDRL